MRHQSPRVAIICGVHSDSILVLQRLKRLGRGGVHDPRTWLRRLGIRPFGRWRDQCLDELVAKAHDLVGAHIAADHAVRQARLERLIHDAAIGREIRFASGHELRQRAALPARFRVAHAAPAPRRSPPVVDRSVRPSTRPWPPLPRFCFSTRGPAVRSRCGIASTERLRGTVQVRIGPPSEMLRAVQGPPSRPS